MKPKKQKLVYLKLTKEQIEQLKPINSAIGEAELNNQPGMMLAQLHVFNDGNGLAVCRFVNHKISLKLQEAVNPATVGNTTETTNWNKVRIMAGIDR